MTTTTLLDGCSMSKGIGRLGGDQWQPRVAVSGRSALEAWRDGEVWQQWVSLGVGSCRSEELAWLDGDQWQQCVALAGQSEQQGWR